MPTGTTVASFGVHGPPSPMLPTLPLSLCHSVCVCACARVRACMRACLHVCVCVWVRWGWGVVERLRTEYNIWNTLALSEGGREFCTSVICLRHRWLFFLCLCLFICLDLKKKVFCLCFSLFLIFLIFLYCPPPISLSFPPICNC